MAIKFIKLQDEEEKGRRAAGQLGLRSNMTPLMQFIIAKIQKFGNVQHTHPKKKKKALQRMGQITLYTAKMPYPANGMS